MTYFNCSPQAEQLGREVHSLIQRAQEVRDACRSTELHTETILMCEVITSLADALVSLRTIQVGSGKEGGV